MQQARPPKGKLDIDAPPSAIGQLALSHASAYRERTLAGGVGRIIFLDRKAWKRIGVGSQHAVVAEDGRLRVEFEIRTRRRERDVKLRVVFYDDQDNPVDVTPVVPYRFVPHYVKQVIVTAVVRDATRYICLIADD